MVECDANHQDRHIVSDRTGLKQVDGEVEEVVVLSPIELSCKDQLVHLSDLRVHYSAVDILGHILVLAQVQEDLSDKNTTVQHCREVVRKISGIILLCPNPVLNEAGSLHERAESVECLHKF